MPPRITVWVTDHFIAQRVGAALKTGFGDDAVLGFAPMVTAQHIAATPVHIGYGILRGMDKVAESAEAAGKPWFIADLGYTNPGHFDGNYRIGYKSTQSVFDTSVQASQAPAMEKWKSQSGDALLCPPTDPVCGFYKISEAAWIAEAEALAKQLGLNAKLRRKGDPENLETALTNSGAVIAFNSAVAWRALQKGIPAFSHPTFSTLGSWHGDVKNIEALKQLPREALFRFMLANQLSLFEIQTGKIYDLLARFVPEMAKKGA